jgi:GTP cyclohydrolase II
VAIKKNDLKIDVEESFKSIFLTVSGIQRLARNPRNRILLESFGINIDNLIPVAAPEISIEQWVRILKFYAKRCDYEPAKDILAGLKKIVRGQE